MGYKATKLTCSICGRDFQFPLWDTYKVVFYMPPTFITFNSLYGIPAKPRSNKAPCSHFQFPLWDTLNYSLEQLIDKYPFQFPLWDT